MLDSVPGVVTLVVEASHLGLRGATEFFFGWGTTSEVARLLPSGHLFDSDFLHATGMQDIVHVTLFAGVVLG